MGLYNNTTSYPAPVPTGMPIQNQQESDEVLFPLSFSESSPIAADGVEIPSQLSVAGSIPSLHHGAHNIGMGEEMGSQSSSGTTEYDSPVSSYRAQQNQYMMSNHSFSLVNENAGVYNNYVLSNRDIDNDHDHYEDVFSLDAPELQHPREEVTVPLTYNDCTMDHVTLDSLDNVVQQNYRLWLSTV